jgi:hypothetical protein
MEQLIRSFTAWDERGNRIILHEWEPVGDNKDREEAKSSLAPHLFRTSSGRLVNRIAKGEYQMAQTGAIIRSTDTDAP